MSCSVLENNFLSIEFLILVSLVKTVYPATVHFQVDYITKVTMMLIDCNLLQVTLN